MTKINLSYRIGTINDIDQLQELAIIANGKFQSVFTPDNWEIFNGNLHDRQKFIDILKIAKCFSFSLKKSIIKGNNIQTCLFLKIF